MRLTTIPFSHYNEKARWALDRFAAPYTERGWMPLLHFVGVVLATRGRGGRADRASTRMSTPVLVLDDGRLLCDSSAIARHASEHYGTPETTLYPEEHRAEIEAFERRVSERLGPHTRRLVYYHLLQDSRLMALLADKNVGRVQAWIFKRGFFAERWLLRRALGVNHSRYESSLARMREETTALSEELGDRPYLFGERFTAADLTAACMLAPVLMPPEYGAVLPALEDCSEQTQALIEEFRQTAIGRYGLRMFATERGVCALSQPQASVGAATDGSPRA